MRSLGRYGYLIGLALLALAARLLVGGVLLGGGASVFVLASDDGDAYDAAARGATFGTPIALSARLLGKWDVASGEGVFSRWPQGYWLFLAAQYRILGSAYVSTVILQALLGALGTLAAYRLARSVLDAKAARLAGIGVALGSTGIYLSAGLYAESVYLPLLLGGLALVLCAAERSSGWLAFSRSAVAGAAFGLAEVTRPLALPVTLAAALWLGWQGGPGRWRRLVALGAGWAAAIAPFAVFDLQRVGTVSIFGVGGAEAAHDLARAGLAPGQRLLVLFLSGGWAPLAEPLVSLVSAPGVGAVGRLAEWLVIAAGGGWLLLSAAHRRGVWLLGLAVASIIGPIMVFGLPLVRYRAIADPIFVIWLVAGCQVFGAAAHRAWGWLQPRLASPQVAGGVCAGLGLLAVLPSAYDVWKTASIALAQVSGPAVGTDFLNLYTGADLVQQAPQLTYRLDAQAALQHTFTGWNSPLVPFYLPPYAALLVGWLAWLPYGLAYVVWLAIGIGCLGLAAWAIAPRWTRCYPLVWIGLAALYWPTVLGLAQGQTTAVMLLASAALASGLSSRAPGMRAALGLFGWAAKPQLAVVPVLALVLARGWRSLAAFAAAVSLAGAAAALRLGPAGLASYVELGRQKLHETLTADPQFLPGPTLLHLSQHLFGPGWRADALALVLVLAALAGCIEVWRPGLAHDETRLLQVALLPIVGVIAAPYALVHELTAWLCSFWLVWRYTADKPGARAVVLWLTAAIWLAGNAGVADPLGVGSDVAAGLGLVAVACIVWLVRARRAQIDLAVAVAPQSQLHLSTA